MAASTLRKVSIRAPSQALLDRLHLTDKAFRQDVLGFEAVEHCLGHIEPWLQRRNDDGHAMLVLCLAVIHRDLGRRGFEIFRTRLLHGILKDLSLLRIELVPGSLADDGYDDLVVLGYVSEVMRNLGVLDEIRGAKH